MGGCNCKKSLLNEFNLDTTKEPDNLVIEDKDGLIEQQQQKVKAFKTSLLSKFKNNIRNIGEFSSESEMNEKFPPKFMEYSIKYPYTEKYEGDFEKLIEQEPIKLQNGNYYWGCWNEDCSFEGPGKLLIPDKNVVVEGFWKKGNLFKARLFLPEGIYEGSIENSIFDGQGKMIYNDGSVYEGDFKQGIREGNGVIIWPDGSKYWGEFKKDEINGEGEYAWVNGYTYKGGVQSGIFQGQGYIKAPNGSSYNGQFHNGVYHGKGTFSWGNEHNNNNNNKSKQYGEKYTGEYNYGKREGKGKYFFENGDIFIGTFFDEEPHGEGEYETNTRIYKSFWRNGQNVETPIIITKEFANENEVNNEPLKSDLNFHLKKEDIDFKHLTHLHLDKVKSSYMTISQGNLMVCEGITDMLLNESLQNN